MAATTRPPLVGMLHQGGPEPLELLEQAGEEAGVDKYTLAAERVLGRPLGRPPQATESRQMMGLTAR
ncbi:hypothetical protein HDA32_005357 [Spinactinospora alkalitolerans]|uniref:Uncharacterized protein n=1 Tax=Spinactinospora alkalitolerans TaxID=687207 RepID=A0A852U3S6_9ACTN|nr:hypothetical protein [Spinactinospora alkalitolerans]NYE50237.1 hypothetical protein [Spinactinospora alkalitolerans]